MKHSFVRTVFLGYCILVSLGAVALMLPVCHYGDLSIIDAIFTATSAVSVTGLIVKDTAEVFTIGGKIIILVLIQIGGAGYMSFVTLFFMAIGKNQSISSKRTLKESIDLPSLNVNSIFKKILFVIILTEFLGALVLAIIFMQRYDFFESLWYGFFHSISSFNNAGFSLFSDSFVSFSNNPYMLFFLSLLTIIGGIGYSVILEVYETFTLKKQLGVHSKIMLYGTIFLLLFGAILFMIIEYSNPNTIGGMSFFDKFMNSYFLSANYRTSGFSSIDVGLLKDHSLFYGTIFMAIGGGAGSTAGGIKVATIAILIIAVFYTLKENDENISVFKRSIEQKTINKALAVLMCAVVFVLTATLVLVETQQAPFIKVLFEVVSAFATTGVSTGNGDVASLSEQFDFIGKSIIIMLMLTGRMGVFAFGVLLVGKASKTRFKYPVGRIMV